MPVPGTDSTLDLAYFTGKLPGKDIYSPYRREEPGPRWLGCRTGPEPRPLPEVFLYQRQREGGREGLALWRVTLFSRAEGCEFPISHTARSVKVTDDWLYVYMSLHHCRKDCVDDFLERKEKLKKKREEKFKVNEEKKRKRFSRYRTCHCRTRDMPREIFKKFKGKTKLNKKRKRILLRLMLFGFPSPSSMALPFP